MCNLVISTMFHADAAVSGLHRANKSHPPPPSIRRESTELQGIV